MSTITFPANTIYTGLWVDETYGKAGGLTLTVTSSSSVYLIAFLALFVRLAGNRLWSLFCYFAFQWRSTPEPKDALFQQQQMLLRSSLTDGQSAFGFVRLCFLWRGRTKSSVRRTVPWALIATVHLIG